MLLNPSRTVSGSLQKLSDDPPLVGQQGGLLLGQGLQGGLEPGVQFRSQFLLADWC